MKIIDMWKSTIALKIMAILLGFMISAFGDKLWTWIGIVLLIATCYVAYTQGKGIGHAACSVSKSVARVMEDSQKSAKVDKALLSQVWSVGNGIKGVFAGALIDYVINCVYIVLMLVDIGDSIMPFRLAAFAMTVPYWPLVASFYEGFYTLGAGIVAVMMIGPFILPLFQFAGYMRGPKLWNKTEEAMAKGKRRAKARSRIVKKNRPRGDKPEI